MIISNREEVIDKAFKVFLRMNYEKASLKMLSNACGTVRTGVTYYFPHKLDLFIAVADKYVIKLQSPSNKFAKPADSLAEFIMQYVDGVKKAMENVKELVISSGEEVNECCPNFHYFHFLFQVRMYYPGVREKMEGIFRQEYEMWKRVIQHAIDSGEIKKDTDVEKTAALFRQIFLGMSYEESFFDGLNVNTLKEKFDYLYSMLKA